MWTLLKGVAWAINSIFNVIGFAIASAFLFALAFGFVTVGCSQSLWTNKIACTITLIMNSFK